MLTNAAEAGYVLRRDGREGIVHRRKLLLVVAGAALIGAGSAKAWWEFAPARLAVARDTIEGFVGVPEWLPIDAVSRGGRTVYSKVAFDPPSDDVYAADHINVDCKVAGERDLHASYRGLGARLHLICHETVAIHGAQSFDMAVGDSIDVRLRARVTDGRMIPLGEDRMSVSDTTVVELRAGRLYARRPGRTRLNVHAGVWSLVPIAVTERLANDTLELRPGEFRKWPLPAGRYDIAVRDLSGSRRSFAEFEMIGEGTRCVPARLDPDLIHCLVTDTGVVAVQNKLADGAPRSPRTYVSIVRTQ